MGQNHDEFIRECYSLARSAADNGNQPFGALLVKDGEILLTAENTVNSEGDCTRHAELNLVGSAARTLDADTLCGCILYTSTEPCAMCTGAIYWAGIPVLAYGCSAKALGDTAGGSFVILCRDILARGQRPTQIVGPILEDEGIEIHESFWRQGRSTIRQVFGNTASGT